MDKLRRGVAGYKGQVQALDEVIKRKMPSWVTACLMSSVDDSDSDNDDALTVTPLKPHYKTPSKTVMLHEPRTSAAATADDTNPESVNDKLRVHQYNILLKKVKEKHRIWLSYYSPSKILKTRIENIQEREGRIFAWMALRIMVPDKSGMMYKQFVDKDVFSAYTYFWKFYFNGDQTSADVDLRLLMEIKMKEGEDFRVYLVRAQDRWRKVNESGFIELDDTQFFWYLLKGMQDDCDFQRTVEYARDHNHTLSEFTRNALRIQRLYGHTRHQQDNDSEPGAEEAAMRITMAAMRSSGRDDSCGDDDDDADECKYDMSSDDGGDPDDDATDDLATDDGDQDAFSHTD